MTIGDRIDSTKDKVAGKAKEVAGAATDDKDTEMKGRLQHAKGEAKDTEADIKESFKER